MDDDRGSGSWSEPGESGPPGAGSVEQPHDLERELRLRRLYRAEKAARERLEHRVRELGTALRQRHEQYLEMLGKVQEREERAVQRALRRLSRSEQRFRLVVEGVEDYAIFLLDADGAVTTWNRGAEQILGFAEEEARGLTLSAFRAHEEDDARPALERAREEGRFEDDGWRARKDGSRFWASETITSLTNQDAVVVGFVSIIRDLTERKRSQRTLERMTERLRETVGKLRERSREAERARAAAEEAERRMRFLAESGRVLSASLDPEAVLDELADLAVPALADWVLVFVEDAEGSDANGVFGPARVARGRPSGGDLADRLEEAGIPEAGSGAAVARVLAGQEGLLHSSFEDEEPAAVLGPELGPLAAELETRSVVMVPLVARDEIRGAVVLGAKDPGRHGPDDLLLAEELVRRAASALDNARLYSSAVEANRAKSEFLAVMSHELRTPLNAILGYVDLLDAEVHGSVSEIQREHLQRIGKSSRHLIRLIEEILSFSRLEAGKETIQLDTVTVSELAEEVAEMVEPMAREKGLEFRAEAHTGDVPVRTDPDKVRQVLLNLLMNAVKFTDEGGRVEIRAEVAGERAVFRVRDTGRGIEEDELERIFEPFLQGREVGIGEFGGTGLGLSVSRDLARLVGGDVTVQSEPGKGSTFTVAIPLSASAEEE